MIGSCDWCGRYCQNGEHAEWGEGLQSCLSQGHTGPWHRPDGRALRRCSAHPGPGLNHRTDCPICAWTGVGGRSVLVARRQPCTSPRRTSHSLRDPGPTATERVDVADVRAVLRVYLGSEPPPVVVVGSPLVLAQRLAEIESRVQPALERYRYEPLPERPGWSPEYPDRPWVDRALIAVQEDAVDPAGVQEIAELIADAVASELGRPNDWEYFLPLTVGAGQFDLRSRRISRAIAEGFVRPTGEPAAYARMMAGLAATAGPVLILADEILAPDRPVEMRRDDAGQPAVAPAKSLFIRYPDGWQVGA